MATMYYRQMLTPFNATIMTLTFTSIPVTPSPLRWLKVTGRIGCTGNGSYHSALTWKVGTGTGNYYSNAIRCFTGTSTAADTTVLGSQSTAQAANAQNIGYGTGSTAAANNLGLFEMTIVIDASNSGYLNYSARGGFHDAAGSMHWFSDGAYAGPSGWTQLAFTSAAYFSTNSWMLVEGFA
jgi:hypothetical protein